MVVGFVVGRVWFGLVIENLVFLWVCWIFVCFGLYFWFWVCYGVFSIANGFVGFVGGQWSAVLGSWVLLMSLLCWWLMVLWDFLVVGGCWVCGFC